ncbi:MAG: hypothetical protein LBQ58_10755 [Synergistaceae bacterium]|nr:hypothetical protein [Synergistaceae bacterium]
MTISLSHVVVLEGQATVRLTTRIGPWRVGIHAAQNRMKNAVLSLLRHSSDIVSVADSLRSFGRLDPLPELN